jgi:hypothetical protein
MEAAMKVLGDAAVVVLVVAAIAVVVALNVVGDLWWLNVKVRVARWAFGG